MGEHTYLNIEKRKNSTVFLGVNGLISIFIQKHLEEGSKEAVYIIWRT